MLSSNQWTKMAHFPIYEHIIPHEIILSFVFHNNNMSFMSTQGELFMKSPAMGKYGNNFFSIKKQSPTTWFLFYFIYLFTFLNLIKNIC